MNVSIAVIIPVYNSEIYLDYVFDSLNKQTEYPDEIIFVNDGSTDKSEEMILEFIEKAKSGKNILINQPNGGTASACNKGVEKAVSDYIIILGSDDILLPERIKIDKKILSLDNVDLLFRPSFTFEEFPDKLNFLKKNHNLNKKYYLKDGVEMTIKRRIHIPTNCATLKRAKWNEIGGYNEKIRFSEDFDFWLRFFATKPKIKYEEMPLSAFRFARNYQSKSKNVELKFQSRLQILSDFFGNEANAEYKHLFNFVFAQLHEAMANDSWAISNYNNFRMYYLKGISKGWKNYSIKTHFRFIRSFFKR